MLAREQRQRDKVIAAERQQSEKWKAELIKRKQEIQQARAESQALSEKAEKERLEQQKLNRELEALESRGFIARLLNRKPKSVSTE